MRRVPIIGHDPPDRDRTNTQAADPGNRPRSSGQLTVLWIICEQNRVIGDISGICGNSLVRTGLPRYNESTLGSEAGEIGARDACHYPPRG